MFSTIITFLSLFLAALLVGAIFCVWLIFNPSGLDPGLYITLQQHAIAALNRPMPVLGLLTILAICLSAVLGPGDHTRLGLLIATEICFVTAAVITRFFNQPINAIVSTWNSTAPPAGWEHIRDEWWRWHVLRLIASLIGLGLLIIATLGRA